MLGKIRGDRRWGWSAYGKHPAALDYFRVGDDLPLAGALSDWIDRGFASLALKDRPTISLCSWRFWIREGAGDGLTCGVIRDSADGAGRPYPLMITGSGPLPGSTNNWELMPFACEHVWTRMEHIASRPFSDVTRLEEELQTIPPPRGDWDGFREQGKGLSAKTTEIMERRIRAISDENPFLSLDGETGDHFAAINLCHHLLQLKNGVPPSTVFMGGTGERSWFVPFKRAITKADFVELWTVSERPDENGRP